MTQTMWYLRRDNLIARTNQPEQVLAYMQDGWRFITRKEYERLKPGVPKKLPFTIAADVRRQIQDEAKKLARSDDE